MINRNSALPSRALSQLGGKQSMLLRPDGLRHFCLTLSSPPESASQIGMVPSQSVLADMPITQSKVGDGDAGEIAALPSDELRLGP